MIEAVNDAIADLVFYRTHDGRAVAVVDGKLRFVDLPGGEVQGGLWSMPRFLP